MYAKTEIDLLIEVLVKREKLNLFPTPMPVFLRSVILHPLCNVLLTVRQKLNKSIFAWIA
jgi:hypothetical protein